MNRDLGLVIKDILGIMKDINGWTWRILQNVQESSNAKDVHEVGRIEEERVQWGSIHENHLCLLYHLCKLQSACSWMVHTLDGTQNLSFRMPNDVLLSS